MSLFKEYVTSSAFRLDLSKNMIEWLLLVEACDGYWEPSWAIKTEKACEKRGLCKRVPVDEGKSRKFSKPKLTEEGYIVCQLLKKAGFYSLQKGVAANG